MLQIIFDYQDNSLHISRETIEAIGNPEEISFLLNREKKQFLIWRGGVVVDSTGARRRKPQTINSCVLSKSTEQTADGFRIRDCGTALKALSAFIPGFRNVTAYAFAGQLVMDRAVAFDLSKAHFSDYDEEYNNPQPNPLPEMRRNHWE